MRTITKLFPVLPTWSHALCHSKRGCVGADSDGQLATVRVLRAHHSETPHPRPLLTPQNHCEPSGVLICFTSPARRPHPAAEGVGSRASTRSHWLLCEPSAGRCWKISERMFDFIPYLIRVLVQRSPRLQDATLSSPLAGLLCAWCPPSCVCMCVCASVYLCIAVCMRVHMCMCVHVYIYMSVDACT